MLEINGEAFCRLSSLLGQMIVVLQRGEKPDTGNMGGIFGEIEREAKRLRLETVTKHSSRIKEHFLSGVATAKTMHPMVVELYNRFRDEMESRVLFTIDKGKEGYYEQKSPMLGDVVAEAFPSIAYDIEEAAKCLALDRSTASVFHAIRSLESAIRAMARCLGIADPTKGAERSWFKALSLLRCEIDKRWAPNLIHDGDARLFHELHATLAAIQNPWRNATMHLDQKYTMEEAQNIFDMVGAFMKKVARRMDEDGNPRV
jgi:hypothetical protein